MKTKLILLTVAALVGSGVRMQSISLHPTHRLYPLTQLIFSKPNIFTHEYSRSDRLVNGCILSADSFAADDPVVVN
jgi:hypothetical protein